MSLFTVLSRFLLCLFVLPILNASVSASLAQWLEHWSRKPGVESSNLSRGCEQFFFLSLLIAKLISFSLFSLISSFIRRFFSQFVRSFIYSASTCNLFYLLTQAVPVYGSFLFPSLFVYLGYFEHQCISLFSSVVRALAWVVQRPIKLTQG